MFLRGFVPTWGWKLLLRQAQELQGGQGLGSGDLEAAPPWDSSDCGWKEVSDEATEIRT